ncbi:hypothetical protein VII00023_06017 [Vibrio ichthyoenteri ATCC 700023]|uniref:Uncharacterized protein n=1 Tax=Vibrio ichthyoenteri ATCC 700023 TaxID=870968 RepID=F9S2T9_9VIBR|nr:hypothetical protein [Vibrio ichthyoenteri]EGU38863.1 hypothetical protein VII00023_06017 [Vibrio ichthyoenteri ATCC 700023]
MFVALSILVSVLILLLIYLDAKQRAQSQQHHYRQIVSLRLVMELCRRHRALTHDAMTASEFEATSLAIHSTEKELLLESSKLIGLATFENKPMYRVLQMKVKGLSHDWQQRSFARNQRVHGAAIRHCIFLIDDITLAWLLDSDREDLHDEYHMNWQQVIDSMEVLTQLRICIQELDQPSGEVRIKYYSDKISQKLHQLSLISPLPIHSPLGVNTLATLEQLVGIESIELEQNQLYNLTTDISCLIAQVYDEMLSDITQSLHHPLPDMVAQSAGPDMKKAT